MSRHRPALQGRHDVKCFLLFGEFLMRFCWTAALSAAAVLPCAAADDATEYKGPHGPGMPQEGPNTPKICAPVDGRDITTESMRRIKQLCVDHVLMGGPKMPWQEADLQAIVDRLK